MYLQLRVLNVVHHCVPYS